MDLIISPGVKAKLLDKTPPVTESEIVESFANRTGNDLIDTREEHITDPPTRWFIAETDFGRSLKIVYLLTAEGVVIKTAYGPNIEELRIYQNTAREKLMGKQGSIKGTDDAWDSGTLGREETFVAVSPDTAEEVINEHLDLQLISIRLEKSLIEDFKLIAILNRIGYQPLMRQVLKRFADCEKKRILRDHAVEMMAKVERADQKKAQRQNKAA